MKKVLFILIMTIVVIASCKNRVSGNAKYTVVGVQTVSGLLDNPDIFFTDPRYENIKPLNVLGEVEISMSSSFDLKRKYHAGTYQVEKQGDKYFLNYMIDPFEDFPSLKGETHFVVGKKLDKHVSKIESAKPELLAEAIPLFATFSRDDFEKINKELLQETLDFAEIVCNIDGTLVKYTLRKLYEN
ncbi:MAG: hypothetical protein IJU92_02425 [Spirochaetaceae bacterium]|nr:hypothetical protein [Spirochaetaceae bacterium]